MRKVVKECLGSIKNPSPSRQLVPVNRAFSAPDYMLRAFSHVNTTRTSLSNMDPVIRGDPLSIGDPKVTGYKSYSTASVAVYVLTTYVSAICELIHMTYGSEILQFAKFIQDSAPFISFVGTLISAGRFKLQTDQLDELRKHVDGVPIDKLEQLVLRLEVIGQHNLITLLKLEDVRAKMEKSVKYQERKADLAWELLNMEDSSPSPAVDTAAESLVRIIWLDYSGQVRCHVVPLKHFLKVVSNSGFRLPSSSVNVSSYMDSYPVADGNTSEICLMPDLSTRCQIPWAKPHHIVLAEMHLKPGNNWDCCPRDALRRVSKLVKDEFEMEINVGFEVEFVLLRRSQMDGKEPWVAFEATPFYSSSAIDSANDVIVDIISSLRSFNIEVQGVCSEGGRGQFKFTLADTVCERAADHVVFAREVVRAVAQEYDLLATFYSSFKSVSKSSVRICLPKNEKEFMAGVLDHPSVLAFTAPFPISYERIQFNAWSSPYIAFDSCANPHLALASILAAGIEGMRRPVHEDIVHESKVNHFPKSLMESTEALEKDLEMHLILGKNLCDSIVRVRKAEVSYFSENKEACKDLMHKY